ncbi:hypothetical protein LINPERHAP2_LOCUS22287 [Linum perenne]
MGSSRTQGWTNQKGNPFFVSQGKWSCLEVEDRVQWLVIRRKGVEAMRRID